MTSRHLHYLARPVIDEGVRVIVEGASWWDLAACRGMDTEIFYYKDTYSARAKQICKGCPVQMECLQDAMEREPDDLRHGIWGGLSSGERRTLANKRRRARQSGRL